MWEALAASAIAGPGKVISVSARGLTKPMTTQELNLNTFSNELFTIEDDLGFEFSHVRIGTWRFDQVLVLTRGLPPWVQDPTLLDLPGVHAAYVFNSRFQLHQSEIFIDNAPLLGMDIARVSMVDHPTLGPVIDVSKNYGRLDGGPGMWIGAASHMWFGPWASDALGISVPSNFAGRVEMTRTTFVELPHGENLVPDSYQIESYRLFRSAAGVDLAGRLREQKLYELFPD